MTNAEQFSAGVVGLWAAAGAIALITLDDFPRGVTRKQEIHEATSLVFVAPVLAIFVMVCALYVAAKAAVRAVGKLLVWLWRRARCAAGDHDGLRLIARYGFASAHVGCTHCKRQFGMNDDARAFVPWATISAESRLMGYQPDPARVKAVLG